MTKKQDQPIPDTGLYTRTPVGKQPSTGSGAFIQHKTVQERIELGKTARVRTPRAEHAAWSPSPNRTDPVDLLEEQGKLRVAELVPIRYGRMLASPFAFIGVLR